MASEAKASNANAEKSARFSVFLTKGLDEAMLHCEACEKKPAQNMDTKSRTLQPENITSFCCWNSFPEKGISAA